MSKIEQGAKPKILLSGGFMEETDNIHKMYEQLVLRFFNGKKEDSRGFLLNHESGHARGILELLEDEKS
ncbi:MAG: hypothetical protein U9O94_06730 [Nanoarchaeota archaeon]|nr:hypothetical protein [Nanoarchaeota archaeon]